jgi:diguanylate cyclase (GGDEF)-like protein/PAS domain S-box-containing protein
MTGSGKQFTPRIVVQLAMVAFACVTCIATPLAPWFGVLAMPAGIGAGLAALACALWLWLQDRRSAGADSVFQAAEFRHLLDAAPEGIIGVGADGRIQFANEESQRLFQYREAELLERPVELLIPERFSSRHVEVRAAFTAQPGRRMMGSGVEVWGRRKDGSEFPADVSLSRVSTGHGLLIISIIRDVTEQKQTQSMLIEINRKLQLGLEENQRRAEGLHLLSRMGHLLQSSRSEKESYAIVARHAARLFPECSGALYVINESRDAVLSVAAWGEHAGSITNQFTPAACQSLRSGRAHIVDEKNGAARCLHAAAEQGGLHVCVPMLARGDYIGVLHLSAADSSALEQSRFELLRAAADHIGLSTANLRLREALRMQSICDPLTGLYNRRFTQEWLKRELPRGSRKGRPTSLLMLDLDHFKRFNDNFGHECGDLVLQKVSTLLRESVRSSDVACRMGGEELALLLPETSLTDAAAIAEKLRARIEALAVFYDGQSCGRITVSIGVARAPEHGTSPEALIRAADTVLYRAKAAGRNRVVVATDVNEEAQACSA